MHFQQQKTSTLGIELLFFFLMVLWRLSERKGEEKSTTTSRRTNTQACIAKFVVVNNATSHSRGRVTDAEGGVRGWAVAGGNSFWVLCLINYCYYNL